MDVFTSAYLANLAANLSALILPKAARRLQEQWQGEPSAAALQRCLQAGVLGMVSKASLDADSAATVLDELKSIAEEEGITVLCSLHQEEFALRYATRIVGLRQGELVVNVSRHAFGPAERSAIYA